MTVKNLEMLFDYGYWANRKLFEVISHLPPEQFTQSVGGSYGSIRNTMTHILSVELGWADRCGGPKRGPRLNPADFPTIESLMERWNTVEANIREFLSTLTDDDLTRMVEYPNDRGELLTMPLGELLQHAANHAVHHRGQVALLLRMLGQSPGNFDILIYFAEKRGVRAW